MNTTTTYHITPLEDNYAAGKAKYRESVYAVANSETGIDILGYLVHRHYRTGKQTWIATDPTCDHRTVGYGATQAEALTALGEYLTVN